MHVFCGLHKCTPQEDQDGFCRPRKIHKCLFLDLQEGHHVPNAVIIETSFHVHPLLLSVDQHVL